MTEYSESTEMRNRLKSLPRVSPPESLWQSIEAGLRPTTENHHHNNLPQPKKLFIWKTAVVSLAASLVMVTIISWWKLIPANNQNPEAALEAIIAQNNLLQQQNQDVQLQFQLAEYWVVEDNLAQIEKSLQQAYSNQATTAEKLKLWEQRHKILQQRFALKKQTHTDQI